MFTLRVNTMLGNARKLSAIKGRLSTPRGFLVFGGQYLKQIVVESMERGRDPFNGQVWKQTSAFTKGSRPKSGASAKTLVDTGGLLQSLVASEPKITRDLVTIGSNKPYARLHQLGGIIRPRKAKFLAIPKTRKARLAGSPRRMRLGSGEKLRDHFAFTKGPVKIPRRRYIGYNGRHKTELRRMYKRWIETGAK